MSVWRVRCRTRRKARPRPRPTFPATDTTPTTAFRVWLMVLTQILPRRTESLALCTAGHRRPRPHPCPRPRPRGVVRLSPHHPTQTDLQWLLLDLEGKLSGATCGHRRALTYKTCCVFASRYMPCKSRGLSPPTPLPETPFPSCPHVVEMSVPHSNTQMMPVQLFT